MAGPQPCPASLPNSSTALGATANSLFAHPLFPLQNFKWFQRQQGDATKEKKAARVLECAAASAAGKQWIPPEQLPKEQKE